MTTFATMQHQASRRFPHRQAVKMRKPQVPLLSLSVTFFQLSTLLWLHTSCTPDPYLSTHPMLASNKAPATTGLDLSTTHYFISNHLGYPPSGKNYIPPRRDVSRYMILLLVAADVESNPGPRKPKYPCSTCGKAVT